MDALVLFQACFNIALDSGIATEKHYAPIMKYKFMLPAGAQKQITEQVDKLRKTQVEKAGDMKTKARKVLKTKSPAASSSGGANDDDMAAARRMFGL